MSRVTEIIEAIKKHMIDSFTNEPNLQGPAYRYGFLAVALVLLGFSGWASLDSTSYSRGGRYSGMICPIMLFLNHLAFQFRWRRIVMFTLRIAALAWLAFGTAYIGYVVAFM